jgi:hypothetical protein
MFVLSLSIRRGDMLVRSRMLAGMLDNGIEVAGMSLSDRAVHHAVPLQGFDVATNGAR